MKAPMDLCFKVTEERQIGVIFNVLSYKLRGSEF